jgi:hypothetical protein
MRGKKHFGSPFAFPDVWQTVTGIEFAFLFLIPSILIITLTCNTNLLIARIGKISSRMDAYTISIYKDI